MALLFLFAAVGCEKQKAQSAAVGGSAKGKAAEKAASGDTETLTILCGASFLKPVEELCSRAPAEAGVECAISAAGSEEFLALIKTGGQGDILITHDPYLDTMRTYGVLAGSVPVGYVAPVLAVARGNPKNLEKLEDLKQSGLRVGMTDPKYSTCGEMVYELLDRKGWKEEVLANVGNRLTKGHNNLGTLLKTDAIDAAIMWNGVAATFREDVKIVPTPYEYAETIGVHVIGLNHSKHEEAVERFLELAEKDGKEVFERHGYTK